MKNSTFSPATIQVSSGAVVTFTNSDGFSHNVTFANTAIASTANFSSGSQALTMPAAAGVYAFRCTIHGGMTGTVTVK